MTTGLYGFLVVFCGFIVVFGGFLVVFGGFWWFFSGHHKFKAKRGCQCKSYFKLTSELKLMDFNLMFCSLFLIRA